MRIFISLSKAMMVVALLTPFIAANAQDAGEFASDDVYDSANTRAGSPAVSVSPLPDVLETNYRYNNSAHQQSNLATAYDPLVNHWWQYFVYWDENREAHITRRDFSNNGSWQTPVNIHEALGGDQLEEDSHNTIAIGVDKEGYLHVSGNHHVDPLNYAMSSSPHNLYGFSNRSSMVPSDARNSEGRVTYPTFFNTADGQLMFFYRNQLVSPSRFASYLNRWNPVALQWERVAKIAEGRELRFYNQRIGVDTTGGIHHGRIHMMAMWRDDSRTGSGSGSGVADNEDLFHLYSDDNGDSWYQYGGTAALDLPLSLGGVEKLIIDSKPYPKSVYFANQSGMELDSDGRPHALVAMSDREGQRNRYYYHIWHTGERWQTNKLSAYRPGSRSAVITTRRGEVYGMLTRSVNNQSRFVLLNLTPGSNRYDDEVITLTSGLTAAGSSANYDAAALYHHNRLSFLVTRSPMTPASSNVNYLQDASVVTLDLDQLDSLRNFPFLAPALYEVQRESESINASTNSGNVLYSTPVISKDVRGRPMSFQLEVNAYMEGSGTGVISLRHLSGSGTRLSGQLNFNKSGSSSATTTILPLFDFQTGALDVVGSVRGGTGVLKVNSVSIKVFRLNAVPQSNAGSEVQVQPTPVVTTQSNPPNCVDNDGDGWGWNGQSTCLVYPLDELPVVRTDCLDIDADGWGWDGEQTCRP